MPTKLQIGLNTLFLIPGEVGGTENYARSLIKALQKKDTTTNYTIFCNRENKKLFTHLPDNFSAFHCPISAKNRVNRILYEQLLFPEVVKQRCHLLHSLGYISPAIEGCKTVATVHDANWLDQPQDFSLLEREIMKVLMRRTLKTSDAVVTDSSFASSRLKQHFPNAAGKINSINPGISRAWLSEKQGAVIPFSPGEYALCVSAFYPHKKIPYLLKVWERYSQQAAHPLRLVLIGKNGRERSAVLRLARNMPNVTHISQVSFPELIAWYRHAAFILFPSIYEGYGYSPYEAVLLGKRAVVGNKGLYEQAIHPWLSKLSFNVGQDSKLISRLAQHTLTERVSVTPPSIPTPEDAAEQYLMLYQALLSDSEQNTSLQRLIF